MGGFPKAWPSSIKSTAIDMLRDEAARGVGKMEAAENVADKFTAGPKPGTVVNWANEAGIEFKDARHASPHPVDATKIATPNKVETIDIKFLAQRNQHLVEENERLATSNDQLLGENQRLNGRVEELSLDNLRLNEEARLLRKVASHYLTADAN